MTAKVGDLTFTLAWNGDHAHIHPTWERAHVTDGPECWCAPTYSVLCDQGEACKGCWKCIDGWVRVSKDEAPIAGEPVLVLHR